MIYVVIDTNIYMSILLDRDEYEYKISNELYNDIISQNTIEYKHSEKKLNESILVLKTLCENNVIKLIVPEVILLELEKHNKKIKSDFHLNFNKLRNSIKTQDLWNEVNYMKNDLLSIIDANETTNINNWDQGYQNLLEFLKKPYIIKVNLDYKDICNLYRKTICGEINDSQSNDFLFLSSVYNYMEDIYSENTKLILVTGDKKDFFNKNKIKIDSREFSVLKDELKHEFIDFLGVEHIKTLYKYIDAYVDITKLIDYKQEYLDLNHLDFENDLYLAYLETEAKSTIFKDNDALNYFNKKNKSFDEINEKRNKIIIDIKELLSKSRSLKSWDDRSELKIYRWLNCHREEELEVLTLSELFSIKNSLNDYYEIHLDNKKEV